MTVDLYFDSDIPEGMRTYSDREEVAGIEFRIQNAIAFASGTEQALELLPEPTNPHDANAIMVIGSYVTGPFRHKVHIGYVSAETARFVAENHWTSYAMARLRNVWAGGYHRPVVIVRFSILVPREPPKPRTKAKKSPKR